MFAPEGHTVLKFKIGSIVDGNLAVVAVADGASIEIQSIPDLETKIETPKKKARKG
jgi:hypothetical protein